MLPWPYILAQTEDTAGGLSCFQRHSWPCSQAGLLRPRVGRGARRDQWLFLLKTVRLTAIPVWLSLPLSLSNTICPAIHWCWGRGEQRVSDILYVRCSSLCLSLPTSLPIDLFVSTLHYVFPGGSAGKESACNLGVLGSIPGLGRSPGEGNGYSLQYSCLENSMDRAWQAIVLGVAKSQTWLSD